MKGVGPPAPAQKSTYVYDVTEEPRALCRMFATSLAGEAFCTMGARNCQQRVRQDWTFSRRY